MATQTGYKASELGIIPHDWEVEELGAVAKVEMCRRIFKNETLNVGDIPFYKIGTFGGEADAYISRQLFEEYKSKYPYPKIGDVLISAAGTIGRVVVFDGEEAYYQDSNIVWLNINKAKISNSFLYYFYQKTEWNSLEGSTIKRLYNNDLLSKKIAIPKSTAEQTAIATALSDTDALISSLQTLITKKQAIKLSAMQNLLSGKIRLPEFALRPDGSPKTTHQTELGLLPEDWEVVELGDVLSLVLNKKVDVPFFTFIGMQDVSEEAKIINQTVLPITQLKSGLTYFEKNDVLVAKITPCFENGKGGYAHNLKTQIGFGSTEFHILRANQQADAEFIYYWTISPKFRQQLALDMVGSAGHKRVPFQALQKFKIPLPSKPEQTAIAQLLSDMDAEIESLECRLKKTQSLKQGMMQTLLAGKIRLPLE